MRTLLGAAPFTCRIAMAVCVLFLISAPARAQEQQNKSAFSDWSAIVLAGDWHAHSGAPSEVFDNARRDASKALVRAGFQASNVYQFSVRPDRYPTTRPRPTSLQAVYEVLEHVPPTARGGCLVYMTSHGGPDGIAFGDYTLTPALLAAMLDQTCGQRPTVAIISACFSGVFVGPLSRPDRMIITAARSDRASFGCGESDVYTFFDNCFLSELPESQDFPSLATSVKACIAQREKADGVSPASEPQVYIGPRVRPILALLQFNPKPAVLTRR